MSTEQEYDAKSSILENDAETNERSVGHGPEPGHYPNTQYRHQHHMSQTGIPHAQQQQQQQHPIPQAKPGAQGRERGQAGETNGHGHGVNQMFDQYDPMLDADPFGLSASMHFPTNYSFDQPPQR